MPNSIVSLASANYVSGELKMILEHDEMVNNFHIFMDHYPKGRNSGGEEIYYKVGISKIPRKHTVEDEFNTDYIETSCGYEAVNAFEFFCGVAKIGGNVNTTELVVEMQRNISKNS